MLRRRGRGLHSYLAVGVADPARDGASGRRVHRAAGRVVGRSVGRHSHVFHRVLRNRNDQTDVNINYTFEKVSVSRRAVFTHGNHCVIVTTSICYTRQPLCYCNNINMLHTVTIVLL